MLIFTNDSHVNKRNRYIGQYRSGLRLDQNIILHIIGQYVTLCHHLICYVICHVILPSHMAETQCHPWKHLICLDFLSLCIQTILYGVLSCRWFTFGFWLAPLWPWMNLLTVLEFCSSFIWNFLTIIYFHVELLKISKSQRHHKWNVWVFKNSYFKCFHIVLELYFFQRLWH